MAGRSNGGAAAAQHLGEARRALDEERWREARTAAARAIGLAPGSDEARALFAEAGRAMRQRAGSGIAGQRRQISVLFADLVGSTLLSGRRDPERYRDVIASYQAACGVAIERVGGTTARFAGDGILAYFGWPVASDDDACRAAAAGLAIVDAVAGLSAQLVEEYGSGLSVRVGIDSGLVVIGDLGTATTPDADAIVGLTPNMAARLEGLAAPDTVVVGEVAHELIRGAFELESLGTAELRGVGRPTRIHRVVRAVDGVGPGGTDRLRDVPFAGREAERDRLLTLWAEARTPPDHDRPDGSPIADGPGGGSPIVLVTGEAGVGKSRLVDLVRAAADQDSLDRLSATCRSYEARQPFGPIGDLLAEWLDLPAADERTDADLATLRTAVEPLDLPDDGPDLLAAMIGLPGAAPPPLDEGERYKRTVAVVVDWCRALARRAPLLVVIDDLHDADEATLDVVGLLATPPLAPGLLVVATARSPFEPPWGADAHVERIDLGPLTADESHGLVTRLLGPDARADEIVGQAGGNPLFIGELCRARQLDLDVRQLDTTGFALGGSEWIPPRLKELLTAQLDLVGPNREAVALLATLGDAVEIGTFDELCGARSLDASAAVAVLTERGLLATDRSGPDPLYRFRHALFRRVAYETQQVGERVEAHGSIADHLSGQALAGRPINGVTIAHHLEQGGRLAEAAFQLQATSVAVYESSGSLDDVLQLLDRAAELVERVAEAERPMLDFSSSVLLGLFHATRDGFGSAEAGRCYQRALERCREMGDQVFLAPLLIATWAYYSVRGDHRTAGDLLPVMEAAIDGDELGLLRPELLSCIGNQRFFEGRFAESEAAFTAALDGFAQRGGQVSDLWRMPNDPIVTTHAELSGVHWFQGAVDRAAAAVAEAERRAETLPFPAGAHSAVFAALSAGLIGELEGDDARAMAAGKLIVETSDQFGLRFWHHAGQLRVLYAEGRQTDPVEAAEAMAVTLDEWRQLGAHAFEPYHLTNRAELYRLGGRLDEAIAHATAAIDSARRSGEEFFLAESLRIRGRARVDAGDIAPAVGDLEEAVAVATGQGARRLVLRSLVELNSAVPEPDRPEDAGQRLGAVVAELGPRPGDPELATAAGLLA